MGKPALLDPISLAASRSIGVMRSIMVSVMRMQGPPTLTVPMGTVPASRKIGNATAAVPALISLKNLCAAGRASAFDECEKFFQRARRVGAVALAFEALLGDKLQDVLIVET